MQKQTMIIIAVGLFIVAALLGVGIVAVVLLQGGGEQTYQVPVASRSIEKNQKISEQDLTTKETKNKPSPGTITDSSRIVGKIADRNIQGGSSFTEGQLRSHYNVVQAVESMPPGTRIKRSMIRVKESEEQVENSVPEVDRLVGKLVRKGIPANSVIKRDQIHFEVARYVVANESITPNSLVRETQLGFKTMPAKYPDGVTEKGQIVDRAVRTEIKPGEVIRSSDLYQGEPELSYFIPLYKRAVTIPVSNYNNVSYMIRPGDRVDLYTYLPSGMQKGMKGIPGMQNRGSDPLSTDVLQKVADNAEVLTLDRVYQNKQIQQIEQSNQGKGRFTYNNMTLGLSLREAEKVNLVRGLQVSGSGRSESASFFVILRPRILKSRYGRRRLNTYDLFDAQLGDKADKEINARSIEVIQGQNSQVYQVPEKR